MEPAEKADKQKSSNENGRYWVYFAGISLVSGGLCYIVWRYSFGIPDIPPKYAFVAQSCLNILLFSVVAAQAAIYDIQRHIMEKSLRQTEVVIMEMRKQNATMRAQLSPRLHVEGVTVKDFEPGRQALFFVEIVNSGPVSAENIAIYMKLETGLSVGKTDIHWGREQIVSIPSNSHRKYFLPWSGNLTTEEIAAFDSRTTLRVSGYYRITDSDPQNYCYKYNPCGRRTKDVPQFIPCDFDPGVATTFTSIGTASATSSASGVGTSTFTNGHEEDKDDGTPAAS